MPTVDLEAGTDLIVYAVGSLDDDTFTFYTQDDQRTRGAPTARQHRQQPARPTAAPTPPCVLAVAAGALALTGTGLLATRRRQH